MLVVPYLASRAEAMEGAMVRVSVAALMLLVGLATSCGAWSTDGHSIICNLAQPMLTPATTAQVNTLLNAEYQQNFTTLCTWGTEVQYLPQYTWSPPLHIINTPDRLCSYNYSRDCVGVNGQPDYCATGAINNYTLQLADPNSTYNKTEALLFLSNILGDIHQPLRVGFLGDGGGSFVNVWWLNTLNGSKTDLFSVWDSRMLHETYERQFNQSTPTYNETIVDILGNMSISVAASIPSSEVGAWGACPAGPAACPDIYALESVELACQYAYANVTEDQILGEDYFSTRMPVVEQRLQQAAVRLAATLNRLFDPSYVSPPLAATPAVPPSTAPNDTATSGMVSTRN